VIHLERVSLPRGLSALAHRDPDGNLVIFVSTALDATRQRAAVMEAIRATRRGAWRAGLPPVGLALVLGIKTAFRRVASALRTRPLAWGAAATATAAGVATAGALIITAPHHGSPPTAAGPGPEPTAALPQPSHRSPAHSGHHTRPGSGTRLVASNGGPTPGQPSGAGKPGPKPASGGGSPAPSPTEPAPEPSPSPTEPAPSPSPTGGDGVCVTLLVVKACLPPVTVKVKL
jgi:hypothetical protein